MRPISKAQARQRSGRAGRECPGVCYRLYPEEAFLRLDENTVPEIQRCNLRSKLLHFSLFFGLFLSCYHHGLHYFWVHMLYPF